MVCYQSTLSVLSEVYSRGLQSDPLNGEENPNVFWWQVGLGGACSKMEGRVDAEISLNPSQPSKRRTFRHVTPHAAGHPHLTTG